MLLAAVVLPSLSLSLAAALELSPALPDLSSIADMATAVQKNNATHIALDPSAWPQWFVAELVLAQNNANQNTTYTGTVWASSPSGQMRYTGSQTTVFAGGRTHTGIFTWIESAHHGTKTLFAPDPNSADPTSPSVICRTSPMDAAESAKGSATGYVLSDYTLIGERIVGLYFDTSVPAPGFSAIFADPFQNQPAAMFSQDRPGNSQQAVYNNMRPATSGTVLSQFSVPPGMKCTTSDDLPALPKAALWV